MSDIENSADTREADHTDVELLRKFRDMVLLRFSINRLFVRFYHRYSPAVATWRQDNDLDEMQWLGQMDLSVS